MRIAILGIGKMGNWLAKLLFENNEVAVYDIDSTMAKSVENVTILSEISELQNFKPNLLINSVSLQNTIQAFKSVTDYIPSYCIISDVASIKGEIPEYYKNSGFRFASVHPMFGPTLADMNSLKKENAIIIKESDREIKDFFRELFIHIGLKIFEYSFAEHDEMMAYSLTTPFVSSLVFAACMDTSAVPGTNFARHRKIAQGLLAEDDNLLMEILFNKHSLNQLDKITARLEFLKHIIRGRDNDEARRFFEGLRQNIEQNRME